MDEILLLFKTITTDDEFSEYSKKQENAKKNAREIFYQYVLNMHLDDKKKGYFEASDFIRMLDNHAWLKSKNIKVDKYGFPVFPKKKKPTGRKIGRPRGKSQKTIQRHNWIRDMYKKYRRKRTSSTLAEFAGDILSEMKENTPRFFENGIYKKSIILKDQEDGIAEIIYPFHNIKPRPVARFFVSGMMGRF